ncbi:unnamed protein product [Mytilus coruscus]|uniref:Uncharacterized protein n=1 Tax=Mytilus coruscus TaxID=42192 RepID=A0A6J8ELW3_MYTCO|nr:unnamed protein product [Mytilus coruscus]
MDEDEVNFERNLSGFILSVLYTACIESEADTLSDRQTKTGDTDKTTLGTNKGKEGTSSGEERAAFFRDVRSKELDRLIANKGDVEDMNTKKDEETASEEERASFFRDVRSKEVDRLTATLNKQSDEAGNQDLQTEPHIMNKEGVTEALETEETATEEERLAFFRSVRDAERKKLVEAFEQEKIWREERENKRMRRRQEKIKKMFEEFHTPAVSALSVSYSSTEQDPGPSNGHYHKYPSNSNTEYNILLKASVSRLHERVHAFVQEQKELQQHIEQTHAANPRAVPEEKKENRHIGIRASSDAEIPVDRINKVKREGSVRRFVNRIFKKSKSTTADFKTKQVDTEELKLDLTLFGDNKDEDNEEEDNPDTRRSSNSEWYTFSDIEDPPRPRLKPFFTQLEERHETIRAHLSGSTKPKSSESVYSILLDLTSKNSLEPANSYTQEPIKRLSTESSDRNEPTKSVHIEITDPKHRESTIEHSLKSTVKAFYLSILYTACSESEADPLSDQQTKTDYTDKTTLETTLEKEDTASEVESAAFFRDVRSIELDRLIANKGDVEGMNTEKDEETPSEEERAAFFRDVRSKELTRLTTNKGDAEAMNTEKDEETASEEERATFFKNVSSKELDRLTATVNKQSDEAGNQDVQAELKTMKEDICKIRVK